MKGQLLLDLLRRLFGGDFCLECWMSMSSLKKYDLKIGPILEHSSNKS